jgi:hypothetical protein
MPFAELTHRTYLRRSTPARGSINRTRRGATILGHRRYWLNPTLRLGHARITGRESARVRRESHWWRVLPENFALAPSQVAARCHHSAATFRAVLRASDS